MLEKFRIYFTLVVFIFYSNIYLHNKLIENKRFSSLLVDQLFNYICTIYLLFIYFLIYLKLCLFYISEFLSTLAENNP